MMLDSEIELDRNHLLAIRENMLQTIEINYYFFSRLKKAASHEGYDPPLQGG